MLALIQRHLDGQHRLDGLFDRHPDGPPPAFRALQRQLNALNIDVTEAVVTEACRLSECRPGLTVNQFARYLSHRQH